jgi:hypothetical protein
LALQDTCIHNNFLGALGELADSNVGQSYSEVSGGPDFITGHFPGHNALRINSVTEIVRTASLTDVGFNTGEGAIGFWVYLDGYSITNGVPTDATSRIFIDTFQWPPLSAPTIQLNPLSNRFRFTINWGASFSVWDVTTGFTIPANTWTYVLFKWKNSEPIKKRSIFIGDESSITEIASSSTSFTTVSLAGALNKIRIGGQQNDALPANGGFEDIKWFKDASDSNIIDIKANRNTLGFAVPGGFNQLDGCLNSPLLDQGALN